MRKVDSLEALEPGEFALIRVDPFTGVPVDEAGKWVGGQRHTYLCFGSERDARDFAHEALQRDRLAEFSLFAPTGEQIAVLHDKVALADQASPKRKRFWQRLVESLRKGR